MGKRQSQECFVYFKITLLHQVPEKIRCPSTRFFILTDKIKPHTEDPMCVISNPHLSLPPDLAP